MAELIRTRMLCKIDAPHLLAGFCPGKQVGRVFLYNLIL